MDIKKTNSALSYILGEIRANQLPHTFVLEGKDEKSRREAALFCACALDCECETGADVPCEKCAPCSKILSGRHPDVTVIGKDNDAKVSVDDVRKVRSDVYQSAFEAENKVVILNQAHLLNVQSQNALLKILEEGPEKVYFILTCPSANMLLPTVSSRCTKYSLGELERGEILVTVSELVKGATPEEKERLSSALMMLDGFEMTGKNMERLVFALTVCDKFYNEGEFPFGLLPTKKEESEMLKLTFRMLALCALEISRSKKGVKSESAILTRDAMQKAQSRVSVRYAFSLYELFSEIYEKLEMNANLSAVTAYLRSELTV